MTRKVYKRKRKLGLNHRLKEFGPYLEETLAIWLTHARKNKIYHKLQIVILIDYFFIFF